MTCTLQNLLFTKYYYGNKIKEDEISGSCSTQGRDKCI